MASVWDWIHQQEQTATPEQAEIAERFNEAMEAHNTDNQRCLAILQETRSLAERYGESWWVMMCDHWRMQTMIFETREMDAALDLAVRSAVETRKEKYRAFPQRVCIHEDLIHTYQKKDPVGYETEIRDAIRYMENEVSEGMECRHCIKGLRSGLECDLGNYEKAFSAAMDAAGLADEENSSHYLNASLRDLCGILHAGVRELGEEAYTDILGWSEAADAMLQQEERWGNSKPRPRAEAIMWQAFALLGLQKTEEAQRRYASAVSQEKRTDGLPSEGYFQAAIAYHELSGEPDKAIAVAERQGAVLAGKGENWAEARCAWERCRLRDATGQLREADIEQAMEMTRKFKNPSRALAVLTKGAVSVRESE
ncbi:MAG: hypothetical protein H8F28_27825 [Fibrella sp.]|nr:hypothetical protein [Armatimonadota bacterium]